MAAQGMPKLVACSCSTGVRKFIPVTHVIFDLDGTLLDTEKIYLNVFSGIAAKYGREFTVEIQMKMLGTVAMESARIAVEELNLPIGADECYNQLMETAKLTLGESTLMPGAERLIRHLHAHNVPIAIASNGGMDTFKLKIERHTEVFSLFSHYVMAATDPEVQHFKPAPDVFLICAERFPDNDKPSVERCLVVEDSPVGVTAGIAAGMQVVMVPDPHTTKEQQKNATLVIDSLLNFKPELFGLPSF